jgi:outer membrane protein insertion porin family
LKNGHPSQFSRAPKRIVFLMLFGLSLCVLGHADDTWIGDIHFNGNSLNKSRALEKKIKSRRGQQLDSQKLNNDVKALFETGYFDDVTVEVSSLDKQDSKKHPLSLVTFSVDERPVIKRIDYKGNKKIRPTSFETKVQSEVDAPFDKFKASLDERAILEHYRDEGYANAQVEHYTTLDSKTKKLILTFFITEGERIIVKNISISGTKRFAAKKILKKMKTRRKKVFKNEALTTDIETIESFYKNNGHLDVTVSSPTINIDEEKNEATINVDLSEGPRYTVGDLSFSGSTIFTEKELRKAIVIKRKKQFNQERLDESLGNISSMYADRGYLRTEVKDEPVRNTESGTVDFKISIAESSVVYVDGVYVDGNTYTKEYVIKREVLLKSGDIFSASKMRRSVEKIYNLGFLEDVQVDVQQPRSSELADIIFTVKDGKPGILSAGAGFSSVDRFVGSLQLQHTNLFGRAQRADITYEFGARRQNFEIGWTDPWFLGHRMSGGVDLFNTVRRRDFAGQSSVFRERRRGTSLRLGPRLSDDLGLLFSYTIQTTELFDVDGSIKRDLFPTFGVPKEEANNRDSISQIKSSFLTELAYDTRDNRFDATRGSRNSIALETSGGPFGGDIHFYKPQFSSAWYFPTFWKFVFSVSARGAWVNHFSPSVDVPSSERFFLGGADTVRGYDSNSIIPRTYERSENGITEIRQTPGRIYTILNAEYKFPIVQEKNRTIFQGAFFLDVGGTWLRTNDIDFTTGALDKRMKAGAGFGFRFKTPVFPIRLDFAIPLTPRSTDGTRQGDSKSLQPYFTIGNIF